MCLYNTKKHKLKRLKRCIVNYYKYNLGEEVPNEIKYSTTLESLRAFMHIYNLKEHEVFQYEDIQ